MEESEIYATVGEAGFHSLVGSFYRQVPHDEVLGRLYPKDDLAGAEERLRDFLIFRFGGPSRYIEQRGHPRLRMRHFPFAVDTAARDSWLRLMSAALQEVEMPLEAKQILWAYFESTANAMVNQ